MNEQLARRLTRRVSEVTSGRLAVGAVVASFAITATGCGGDESSDGSQSLAGFRKQAEPICEDVSKKLAKTELPHSFPAELEDFDKRSKQMLAVIAEPFDRLASLTPPEGREAEYGRFSKALKMAVAETRQIRRLVAAGNDDTDALWLPATNVPTHQAQAMNEATKLGLEQCESLDYKAGEH